MSLKDSLRKALAARQMRTKVPPIQEITEMVTTEEDDKIRKVLEDVTINIKVLGCGQVGCRIINRLSRENRIQSTSLYALNSDAQQLLVISAHSKILLGRGICRGLGAGGLPRFGKEAAEESRTQIVESLRGADLAIVVAGLGGGVGTGSAPIVCKFAKELGIFTLALVTFPLIAEGNSRIRNALNGLNALNKSADAVIVIPNDKLLEFEPSLTLSQAFMIADEILLRVVVAITNMINLVGRVNIVFPDFKIAMAGTGIGTVGLGEATNSDAKALDAVNDALNSPLLCINPVTIPKLLIYLSGSKDMTAKDVEMVMDQIYERTNPNAELIWGAYEDPKLVNTVQVMIIAPGSPPDLPSG
jgi:cell division protein FtsZ